MASFLTNEFSKYYEEKINKKPYEIVLEKSECKKIEKLQKKLNQTLNSMIHIWIHDIIHLDKKIEPREIWKIKINKNCLINEIRDIIIERYTKYGYYDKEIDLPLRLLYNGKILKDDTRLSDYPINPKRSKWAKPYAGIIWVVPNYIESTNM